MYTEMTTIEELANKGKIAASARQFLNNANVQTLGDLHYGNPYNLGWLQLPGMNWDVYEELMDLFIRLDTEKALADPQLKALQYENLPKRFQDELATTFDATFDLTTVTTYLEEHGLTVETLHNAAINTPYAIMRLVRDFDFAENALMRRFIRDYLKGEIFALRNDCYAQVREIYATRQFLLPQKYTKLFPEEIVAFYLNGKVKELVDEPFPYFVNVMAFTPATHEIQEQYVQTPKDLLLLFLKPEEAFLRLVGNHYEPDTIDKFILAVGEFGAEMSDRIRDWLNDGDDDDMF